MLHDRTQRLVDDEVRSVRELLDPVVAQIELSSIIPWHIGRYLPVDEVTGPFQNLGTGALVGGATLIFAFLLAAVISFRVR
jgi:hypothetical protein